MGTKNNPGKYDCYEKAGADEPIFTLRANDPVAPLMVEQWANHAQHQGVEADKLEEARLCASEMRNWKREHG